MMYWQLNAVVLGALLALWALTAWRGFAVPTREMAWTAGVLALLTVVFDNLMIAADLFRFGPETLLGWMVGLMPVEDFGYALGAALLVPLVWTVVGRERRIPERSGPNREGKE